jgi:hypothetical protein
MILDAFLQFSSGQAYAGSPVPSTNVVDLGVDGNIGIGEPMGVFINATTAVTTSTVTIAIEVDDNESFTSGTNIQSVTLPVTAATESRYYVAFPPTTSAEQFVRLDITGTGSVTFDAYLVPQSFAGESVDYPIGFSIS